MVAEPRSPAASLRILCIDGGGIKGYTALLILRRILRTLAAETGDGSPPPRPCDVFDLIAGTSTGGIIAVMLGRLHMTVDECIEVYERLGKEVFGKPVGGQLRRIIRGMANSPFYDIADLQRHMRAVMEAKGIAASEPFAETGKPKCRVILCATRIETGKADLLRSYLSVHPTAENYACHIWEAASATAAAPIYFKSVKFASSGEHWCDGSVRRNNPVNEALAEMARVPEWEGREIGCLVSLGTGVARSRPVSANLASFVKGALKMLTDAEDTAKAFAASSLGRELARSNRYFRFNVPQGMEDLQIDEWKATGRMKALATEYLSHADNGDAVWRCANALLSPDENLQRNVKPARPSLTPHAPCTHFLKRTAYEDRLRKFFSPRMGARQIFTLWGLGGVGKTQIALDFAQTMKHRLSVFWIRADSLVNFVADYSQLMPLLDPSDSGKTAPATQTDTPSLLDRTRNKLEELSGEWLLILDNADHLDGFLGSSGLGISEYIPRRGRILITTRDRRFQGSVSAASDGLCVEPMTPSEARDLLLRSVPNHLVRPSAVNTLMADELVAELGGLPLAIAQAAANMVDQQLSFAEYVGLFREKRRRAGLMASPAFDFANRDPRNGTATVATTWAISLDVLKAQSPASVALLRYLGCFHWRDTPQGLLRQLPEFRRLDDAGFLEVVKKPLVLSLIDQTTPAGVGDEDPRLAQYSVHPVLHEILVAETPTEAKREMLEALSAVMFRVFPRFPSQEEEAESWPLATVLAPHLACQMALCQEVGYRSVSVAWLMFSLGRFHLHSEAFNSAADLSEASFAMAQETMESDHELMNAFRSNTIQMLYWAGRYDKAEAECLAGLELLESGAPPAPPAGTTEYNEQKAFLLRGIGAALYGKHDYRRLEEIRTEQIRLEQPKPWSADDIRDRHDLAESQLRNGKWAEAKVTNDELLAFCGTKEGMDIVGKRRYLVMLNLRGLILQLSTDGPRQDELIALYDYVLCETLSNFGIEDVDTWTALKNRVCSLIGAVRMEEVGSVLWTILPAATAAKVQAEGHSGRAMQIVHQAALSYLDYLSNSPLRNPSGPQARTAAEFNALLARWRYVSNLSAAPDQDPICTLNTAGVLLQHRGRYAEAESQHRAALAELARCPGHDPQMERTVHYNLMLAIARDGRVDEARAFRAEHAEMVEPAEAVHGRLEEKLEQGERERGVYEEAVRMLGRGELKREGAWWRENGEVVKKEGMRRGRCLDVP